MPTFKFNKNFRDKELKQEIKANEPVEMTVKRADEIVKNIRKQSDKFTGYKDFAYERVNENEPVSKKDKEDGK